MIGSIGLESQELWWSGNMKIVWSERSIPKRDCRPEDKGDSKVVRCPACKCSMGWIKSGGEVVKCHCGYTKKEK